MSSKIKEAEEHERAAEKWLRSTLFRWHPDYDSAADEYVKAAKCFRVALEPRKACVSNEKAAGLYEKYGAYFHAARALEDNLMITKNIDPPGELYDLAMTAASLYQRHGSDDAAANVLAKAARLIEEKAPAKAVDLYQKAADISSIESANHSTMEHLAKASRIFVKIGTYDDAARCLVREIGLNLGANNFGIVGRLCVALVLVHLARGDIIAAEKCFRRYGSNCEQAEMDTIEQILQAYDDEDRDAVRAALRSPFIRSMDVEYARLANSMKLPSNWEVSRTEAFVKSNENPVVAKRLAEGETSSLLDSLPQPATLQGPAEDEQEGTPNLKDEHKDEEDEGGLC